MEALLQKGAKADEKDSKYEATALHFAANNGHQEVVQVLLQAGADRNIQDNYGQTAVDVARDPAVKGLINNWI